VAYYSLCFEILAHGSDSCLSNLTYTLQRPSLQTLYRGNNRILTLFPAFSENNQLLHDQPYKGLLE